MKLSNHDKMMEHGRIIARAISDIKVEKQKNMIKAVKRRETLLHNAAESLFT